MRPFFFIALLFPFCASAKEVPVCYSGVCRMVEQDPLPSPTRDPGPMQKAAKHRVADAKFWLGAAANIGVSIARTKTLVDCRHDHDFGTCVDGGYGEFRTREALTQTLTGGLTVLSYFHKRAEDQDPDTKYKFWWLFSGINTGMNAGVIIENATKSHKDRDRKGHKED